MAEVSNILELNQAIQLLPSYNMESIMLSTMLKDRTTRQRRSSRICCHTSFENLRISVAL